MINSIFKELDGAQKDTKCKIHLAEVPEKVAANGLSFVGELGETASGRWTILNDVSKTEIWGSPWKIITFIETDASDRKICDEKYIIDLWKFYETELIKIKAINYSCNISCGSEYYFGNDVNSTTSELIDDTTQSFEIRVSWSITDDDLKASLMVWDKMICKIANVSYNVKSKLIDIV